MEVKVRSKGDGLYSCSYTPNSHLKHTVAVAWGGVGVPNSPFRVSRQSQHPVTTGSAILPKSGDLVEAQRVTMVKSEPLVKTESTRVVVQSEPTVLNQSVKSKCPDVSSKAKKPLIIITTYTEQRFSC